MPDQLDPKRRYLCRHVHTDGRRCGSPALRAQNFCYYHDRQRLQNAPLAGRIGIFRMQPIDDRAAIQIAIYDILSRLTAGDIDTKRAATVLYGLQIASSNLARQEKLQPATNLVESIKYDQRLGDLAPSEEIPSERHASVHEIQPCHPEADGVPGQLAGWGRETKDVSSSPAVDFESAPTAPEPRHSEPTAQNLCISPTTEPTSAPTPSEPVILSEAVRIANSEVEGPCHPAQHTTPARRFLPRSPKHHARGVHHVRVHHTRRRSGIGKQAPGS